MAKKTNGNGHGKIGHNRGVLRLYRSYNHVDKDPAIDKLRTAFQLEALSVKQLSILSNVGEGTINGWFKGKTKRPQHTTLAAAAAAMGYDWELSPTKKINYETEMPKAIRWHERQQEKR